MRSLIRTAYGFTDQLPKFSMRGMANSFRPVTGASYLTCAERTDFTGGQEERKSKTFLSFNARQRMLAKAAGLKVKP